MSRRRFIGSVAAAGVAMTAEAWGLTQDAAREGRRLIDVHHHLLSPPSLAKRREMGIGGADLAWTPAQSIEQMDKNGVRTSLISVSTPGIWFGNPEEATRLARATNEYAAGLVRDYPGRFGFFAAVAPPDVDGTLREIEYALDTLKADGVGLLSSYDGRYLGDAAFAPVFSELQRRRAIVFVHPADPRCCVNVLPEVPSTIVEFGFDTTRAVVSLLFSGTFTKCPDVRFILSHGGGTVPFLAGRIWQRSEARMAELKKLYFDTATVINAPALTSILKFVPATQVIFGSDYPFAPANAYANQVVGLRELARTGEMSDAQLSSIEFATAAALFPRLRA